MLFIALSTIGLIYFASLISYSPTENPWSGDVSLTEPVKNIGGVFGAYLGDISLSILGYGAYLIPIALIWFGWCLHKSTGKTPTNRQTFLLRIIASIALLTFTTALLSQNSPEQIGRAHV